MRKFALLAVGLTVVVGLWAIGTTIARAQVFSKDPRVAILDKCDPATFAAGGGGSVPARPKQLRRRAGRGWRAA